jgi:hypothetical protein
MWSHQGMELGLAGLKAGTSFISGLQEAKAARAWQKYNNAMLRISNGQNQNAINVNQNMAVERSTIQGFEIERSEYVTRAAAEAEAAATGTEGRSVNQTLFQIDRNAAVARHQRAADLKAQILGFDQQRMNSAFQTATQIDHTYIPNPSPIAAMMGFAGDAFKINEKYRT